MKKSIKTRITKVLSAVFLAVALLAVPAAAQAAMEETDSWEGPWMRMAARDALGITPEQAKKLEEFRKMRMEESLAFREQMMKMRGELDELTKDPEANEAKINGVIDRMSKLHSDRLKASVKSRMAWEGIFTPEQLEKMRSFRGAFMGRFPRMGRGGMFMGPMGFRGPGRSMRPGRGFWHMRGPGTPGMFPGRPYDWRRR